MKAAASSSARTADFTHHDDGFGLRIILEQLQRINEGCARNRVAADTDTGRLAKAKICGLLHGFIGQCAGTRHDTDLARLVNVTRHDADLALHPA
jgi:hypothetical protein